MLYEKLNQQKKKMGITTEQLSRLSGVPVGTINKILRGETKAPRYDTLQALEKVLFADCGRQWKENETISGHTNDLIRETAEYLTKQQGEYTVEDYLKLPEDMGAELIDGTLIFSEAPDFTHQELVAELIFEFKFYIRKKGGPCRILSSPLDVQLDCDDKTMVQPDIVLICREDRITRKGIYGAPDFCIEVASDSSRKRDYGIKVQKYMNAGVKEYWIVDTKRQKIVCYWFEGKDGPDIAMYTFQDQVPVGIYGSSLKINFPEIVKRLWKEQRKVMIMKEIEMKDRTPLLVEQLLDVWEKSVRATHLFLSGEEIEEIKKFVPAALTAVPHLIVETDTEGIPVAFMGIDEEKLEMLFIAPKERGKGLGRKLLEYGMEKYGVKELAVNEQNPQAKGFYEHMGFRVRERSELDEQGNPYPILFMEIR